MIERTDLFGPDGDQMPVTEIADASIPQIGFIGRNYTVGKDVLLGINPGGGGDAYSRTSEDTVLLPIIERIRRNGGDKEELRELFDQCAANMRTWNLWRIVLPVLEACNRDQSEIAYLNWCPFRTRADKMPRADVMRRCRDNYLLPLIEELGPRRIIALGKKAGNWLDRTPFTNCEKFVVPRTIGDSYVSEQAKAVLERIRGC